MGRLLQTETETGPKPYSDRSLEYFTKKKMPCINCSDKGRIGCRVSAEGQGENARKEAH